jgi:hypothetical protein
MARRLIPQVFEVSAVDKGAGRNCKIVLRKRDEDMPMHTETTTFAKALENVQYAEHEQAFAKQHFGSLANFHKVGPGALVAALKTRDYLARQAEDVAKRDAALIAMTKADGPMSPEDLVAEAQARSDEYHKLGKPRRPLQAFIDQVIAEVNGRNPKPVSP